jgi:hypothetical protein
MASLSGEARPLTIMGIPDEFSIDLGRSAATTLKLGKIHR